MFYKKFDVVYMNLLYLLSFICPIQVIKIYDSDNSLVFDGYLEDFIKDNLYYALNSEVKSLVSSINDNNIDVIKIRLVSDYD